MPNNIQLQAFLKEIQGVVAKKTFCTIEVNGSLRFLNANRNDNGRWLNTNYANPDNKWNDNGAFFWSLPQLFSFLSRLFVWRVLFYDLSMPTTELFTGYRQWF